MNTKYLCQYHEKPDICSICGARDSYLFFGQKYFNESCNDFFIGKRTFNDFGVMIKYWKCTECKVIITNFFDDWGVEQYKEKIYNEDYLKIDTPFKFERPFENSKFIEAIFKYNEKNSLKILDFGGGNGGLYKNLKNSGFEIYFYDHLSQKKDVLPVNFFDIVTSFEVIEHVPHKEQRNWILEIKKYINEKKRNKIFISTELSSDSSSIDDWYISPRNGHITIHSNYSLNIMARMIGFNMLSLSNTMHVFFR